MSIVELVSVFCLFSILAVRAHVEMRDPPPRHSQFSKYYLDHDDVDYNMKAPLGPIVGYPCRNFRPGPVQGTIVAGHPFHVKFDGIATHMGGDCQFAISYDNGTTFAVLWDKLSSCFLDTVNGGYDVPIPDTIPASKKAVFAWTWINGIGSREYYMNCADVRIENYGKQEPYTGHELLVVNLPGMPVVPEKVGHEEDILIPYLMERKYITIGRPTDLTQEEPKGNSKAEKAGDSSNSDSDSDADTTTDNPNNDDNDDATLPDELTSYVSVTRFVTDDSEDDDPEVNLDSGYDYTRGDSLWATDEDSKKSSINSLFTTNSDGEVKELLASFKRLPLGYEGTTSTFEDFPALTTRHPNDEALDLWPVATMRFPHSTTQTQDLGFSPVPPLDLSVSEEKHPKGYMPIHAAEHVAEVERFESSMFMNNSTSITNAHLVTTYNTVTVDNKPVLKVVVSMNNASFTHNTATSPNMSNISNASNSSSGTNSNTEASSSNNSNISNEPNSSNESTPSEESNSTSI